MMMMGFFILNISDRRWWRNLRDFKSTKTREWILFFIWGLWVKYIECFYFPFNCSTFFQSKKKKSRVMLLQESDDETNESVGYGSVCSQLTFTSSQSPIFDWPQQLFWWLHQIWQVLPQLELFHRFQVTSEPETKDFYFLIYFNSFLTEAVII